MGGYLASWMWRQSWRQMAKEVNKQQSKYFLRVVWGVMLLRFRFRLLTFQVPLRGRRHSTEISCCSFQQGTGRLGFVGGNLESETAIRLFGQSGKTEETRRSFPTFIAACNNDVTANIKITFHHWLGQRHDGRLTKYGRRCVFLFIWN